MKYALFLYILLLLGCTKNKADTTIQSDKLLKIPCSDLANEVDISPYVKSVNYVKLELTDKSMFADISTLEAFDDKLYIFDNVTNCVYVFSMDGRFLFVLNNVGQGPGEYTQIDFF